MAKAKQSRDINIIKNYSREINLQTQSIESKKKYTRKTKHKIPILSMNSESL